MRLGAINFIAGDWGTTNLRLFLCDCAGEVLDVKNGPGAAESRGNYAAIFDELTSPWTEQAKSAILCGMVGSRIGWQETPYLPSPVEAAALAASCVQLRDGAVRLVPGLSCRNRIDAPDLMRGEETQVLGALQLDPSLRAGTHLLCLPGTHTKWVMIEEGVITTFMTAPAGELFELISRHSVLVDTAARTTMDERAFEQGVTEFNRHSNAALLNLIFQCRSRWMAGDLAAESTVSFLSGVLIACDVASALKFMGQPTPRQIHIIASAKLSALYAKALACIDVAGRSIDGEAAAVAGLFHLHQLCSR